MVFTGMFAIFFGAYQVGTASALGPDAGKTKVVAENFFKIIEYPS